MILEITGSMVSMVLYKNYMVLPIAFVIVLILSFNVLAQDETSSEIDCEPLPEAERFKALGYELGTCKSDVEQIIKEHGSEIEPIGYGYDLSEGKEIFPEHLSAFKSNYVGAVVPFKENISSEPDIILKFYNDVLTEISISFDYGIKNLTISQLKSLNDDAFKILESAITKRAGKGEIKEKNITVSETWVTTSTSIELSLQSFESIPIYLFTISYKNINLMNLAKQNILEYRQETRKKEYEKQLDDVKGF